MIELRMARLAPIQPRLSKASVQHAETRLAFRYLTLFRRLVVTLALVGTLVAFAEGWTGLAAGFVTIAIGEWLESSYYLNVLHWRQRHRGNSASPSRASSRRLPSARLTPPPARPARWAAARR